MDLSPASYNPFPLQFATKNAQLVSEFCYLPLQLSIMMADSSKFCPAIRCLMVFPHFQRQATPLTSIHGLKNSPVSGTPEGEGMVRDRGAKEVYRTMTV